MQDHDCRTAHYIIFFLSCLFCALQNAKPPVATSPVTKPPEAISPKELMQLESIEKEETEKITDTMLTALDNQSSQDNKTEITTSLTLRTKLKATFATITEKLSSSKVSLAEKQKLLKTFNTTATTQKKPGFEFPYLGKGIFIFAPGTNSKEFRFNITFIPPGKQEKSIRPVLLNNVHLSMIEGKLQGQLDQNDTITVFGEEATCKLTSIEMGTGGVITKVYFAIFFKKPLQKKLPYDNETLTITNGYLVLKTNEADYPITLITQTKFRGKKVRLMLLYDQNKKLSAALRIGKIPLKTLIPSAAGTSLEAMQIIEGRVLIDLSQNASKLRIHAELAAIKTISLDESAIEDITPEEVSQALADELSTDAVASKGATTPAYPSLVTDEEVAIDTNLVKDALPKIEFIETPEETPGKTLEETQAEILPAEEEIIACDTQKDPCCQKKRASGKLTSKAMPTCSMQASFSTSTASVVISMQDVTILPQIGLVGSATARLNVNRTAQVGSEFILELNCVPIKNIGMIESGTITIDLKPLEKEPSEQETFKAAEGRLALLGKMRLSFGALGTLPIDVTAIITRKGMIFTGKLDFCNSSSKKSPSEEQQCTNTSLSYNGLTLEHVKVAYGYPRAQLTTQATHKHKTLSLIATINLWGIRLIATLAREPDLKNPQTYKIGFTAMGVLREFQPFKHIPGIKSIPGLSDVTFDELSAELQLRTVRGKPTPSITLGGAVALFGLMLRANFKWVVSKKGVPGVFMYTTPQPQQSLADAIPLLQHTFFRNITCCNSSFALSSISEIDTAHLSDEEALELEPYNLEKIRKGIVFVANVPLTGSLDQVGKWLGLNKELTQELTASERKRDAAAKQNLCQVKTPMVRLGGNISFDKPQNSEFKIAITKNHLTQLSSAPEVAPLCELEQVEIAFLGNTTQPSAHVSASIIVRPTPKELLHLKGSVEFSPTNVTLGAQMLGTWHNAFTLHGWDLTDVAFMLGFIYGSIIPTRLGGAADLKITTDFSAAFKFMTDVNISEMGFEGKMSRVITLFDLAAMLLKSVKLTMPENIKFPTLLQLREVALKYAPKDIKIGDLLLEAGFTAKANFTLLDKIGTLDIHVDDSGFKAFGSIKPINFLNLLKLSNVDGKGDPAVDVELSLKRQHFLIKGRINIAGIIESSSFIQFSADGFEFDFIEAIGKTEFEGKPLIMAHVIGKSSGSLLKPELKLVLDLQHNFQRYIKEQATKKLKGVEHAVENEINKAQKEIDGIQDVIKKADTKIRAAETRVAEARGALKALRDAQDESNRTFTEAKRQIALFRKEIDELDLWYDALPTA